MFGFLHERRARTIAAQVAPALTAGLRRMSPVERAGTLAIANAMLEVCADTWGDRARSAPLTLPRDTVVAIIRQLGDGHARVVHEGVIPAQPDASGGSQAQAIRQMRAFEILIATFAMRLSPDYKAHAVGAWKLLASARTEAREAARALALFAKATGAEPVPRSRRRPAAPRAEDYQALASTLPPFLTRSKAGARRPAPQRAS